MKRAMFLLAVIGGLWGHSVSAQAREGFRHFRKGEWLAAVDTNYFLSNTNYSSGGSPVSLLSGGQYQLLDVGLSTRYVWASSWAFNGGLNVGNSESRGVDAVRSNSSLTHVNLGLEMAMALGALELIPEFTFVYPFEKVRSGQDAVMNNEGVMEFRSRLHSQIAFGRFNLLGHLGYDWRAEGRAALMPWSLGLELEWGSATLGAKLFGFQSIGQDQDSGNSAKEAERTTLLNKVNAGSLRFYSIDPSLVEAGGYAKFQLTDRILMELSGSATLTGVRSAAGWNVGGALVYRFSADPVKKNRLGTRPKPSERVMIDPFTDQFVEDTEDGVDQEIFRAPPKPQLKPGTDSVPSSTPGSTPSGGRTDEMQIELKSESLPKRRRRN